MDEALWPQIKKIVADALELPAEERADLVRDACQGNPALLERVRVYLERATKDSDFLNMPAFSIHDRVERETPESWIGREVGPFLLKDLLGTGGMGAVYLAEHTGGDYDQDVAVKVLYPSGRTERLVERFQHERRILNSLIHPYIARFLEGGKAGDGSPYLVMQRVDGTPIHEYCKEKDSSLSQSIRLFLQVCDAVQFAHGKLVVHCDLKPGNILITPDGQPRVLDFGIARLLDDDVTRGGASLGGRYLTPLYTSPEQFRGEEPTVATDVYALGLLLYEILTGRKAHRPDHDHLEAIQAAVCDQPPCPPGLGRDLDSTIHKALEKKPEDRYSTVAAFAEDLRRYLAHRTVLSRPQTPGYRASKFLRRNAWGVAAAALLFGLVSWMAVQAMQISLQNEQLHRQNQEIVQERDRATEVREFLVDFLQIPDPSLSQGAELTVKEALGAAAFRLQSELREEPEVRAELLDAIGRVFTKLALYSDAEPLLNDALETRRDALGTEHPLVAASMHNLAYLKRRRGQAAEAELLRRAAIEIQRKAFPAGDPSLGAGLNALASLLREKGDLNEAESLAQEALAMQVRLLGARDLAVARTLNTLASIHRLHGDLSQAEALYRQSLDIRRDHVGPVDPDVAAVLNNLALVLVEMKALPQAIALHREALAMREEIYSGDHPRRITSLANLSIALALSDEHTEAIDRIHQAMAMHERLGGPDPTGRSLRLIQASIVEREGVSARACLETVEPVLSALQAKGRPFQVADAESIRGGCLVRAGRFEDAEPILLESYQELLELRGALARQTRQARERIVRLYQEWGRPEPNL